MRRYWNSFTDEMGQLIVDVALGLAQGKASTTRREDKQYVDTGVGPDDLYRMCLERLLEGGRPDSGGDSWQPLAMWATDSRFQQGMFRFLLNVEEALGHVRVVHDSEGKARVCVAEDLVTTYAPGKARPTLAGAEPA